MEQPTLIPALSRKLPLIDLFIYEMINLNLF